METYKNFFHSYRMPHEDMDRLLPQSRRSNHIVVASCNQFYILRLGQDPLDDPYKTDASSQLSEASIFDQLLRIYRISREHARRQLTSADARKVPKVGLFTAENRKVWARIHKKLLHCNGTASEPSQQVSVSSSSSTSNGQGSGSCSPNTNTESLRQIEDCLFVMCLDSLVSNNSSNNNNAKIHQKLRLKQSSERSLDEKVDGETDVEAANIILTGGGSHLFTANRWFDKFLQIIVGRDGICGINIEHSASEGITVLRFLEDFLDYIKANPIDSACMRRRTSSTSYHNFSSSASTIDHQLHRPATQNDSITSSAYVEPKSPSVLLEESDKITPLMWCLNDELIRDIEQAASRADKLVDNFSLNILNFTKFGRTFIKNQNLSPDAFIQLALQYSFFKIHGRLVSTYESASLRQFRLGRVDNIRANTCEAYQWIQKMLACKLSSGAATTMNGDTAQITSNFTVDWKPAEDSFERAIAKQVEILRYTIFGTGPDNHLLALKQLALIRYDVDELPELFTDESYKEFLNFRLSTSQLPNESGITVGYGAVVPDGYGCSYNPCSNRIMFCVSTFADCPETSSSKFSEVLNESLLEMEQLCLARRPLRT